MIISFFESIKYAGHLWPVAILRIYIGLFFLKAGFEKIHNGFLESPALTEILKRWIEAGSGHPHYTAFLNDFVMPHWQVFSHLVVFAEVFIGMSFIIGLMVRPAALVAMFLNFNFMLAAGAEAQVINMILIFVNLTLCLLGAGRCIGFDYYFYKRVRGIWW